MARITVEDCLKKVGNENRFSLIHLAVARVRQHRDGLPIVAKGKNKENVMTLREIASGAVSFENIHDFKKMPEETEASEAASEQSENQEVAVSS